MFIQSQSSFWLCLAIINTETAGVRHYIQQSIGSSTSVFTSSHTSLLHIYTKRIFSHALTRLAGFLIKMQNGSIHNVAVVKLRFFSYTTAGGSRCLYPLRVSTVRQTFVYLTLNFYELTSFSAFFYSAFIALSVSPQTIFECVFYCNPRKGSKFISLCMCSVTSLTCCMHLSLSLSLSLALFETGEEREEWWRDSSRSSAPPLCWVAPYKTPIHTNSFTPDFWAEEPQSRGNGTSFHSTDSPRYSRHCLAIQPPQRQPNWQHRGLRQVSVLLQTCSHYKIAGNHTVTIKIEFGCVLIVAINKGLPYYKT